MHLTNNLLRSLSMGMVSLVAYGSAPPDYMAVDLVNDNTVRYYPDIASLPEALGPTSDVYRTTQMLFKRIHAYGRPWTCQAITTSGGKNVSKRDDAHTLTFYHDYYMGVASSRTTKTGIARRPPPIRARPSSERTNPTSTASMTCTATCGSCAPTRADKPPSRFRRLFCLEHRRTTLS